MRDIDQLRLDLGLGTDVQLEPLGHEAGPPPSAMGLATMKTLRDIVDREIAASPNNVVPVQLPGGLERVVRVERWMGATKNIFLVQALAGQATVALLRGHCFDDEGFLYLDARSALAAVEVLSPGPSERQSSLLVFDHGEIAAYRIVSWGQKLGLPAAAPSLDPDIELSQLGAPSPLSLTDGLAVAPWLASFATHLVEENTLLAKVASVGIVLRLWSPCSAEDRRVAIARTKQKTGLVHSVRAWATGLGDVIPVVVDTALHEANALEDEMASFEHLPDDSLEHLGQQFRVVVDARDNLESVCAVLETVGQSTALRRTLQRVDRLAASLSSTLRDPEFVSGYVAGRTLEPDEPSLDVQNARLEAVLAHEPDAWWGETSSWVVVA